MTQHRDPHPATPVTTPPADSLPRPDRRPSRRKKVMLGCVMVLVATTALLAPDLFNWRLGVAVAGGAYRAMMSAIDGTGAGAHRGSGVAATPAPATPVPPVARLQMMTLAELPESPDPDDLNGPPVIDLGGLGPVTGTPTGPGTFDPPPAPPTFTDFPPGVKPTPPGPQDPPTQPGPVTPPGPQNPPDPQPSPDPQPPPGPPSPPGPVNPPPPTLGPDGPGPVTDHPGGGPGGGGPPPVVPPPVGPDPGVFVLPPDDQHLDPSTPPSTGLAGVPEPSTWLMLMLGLGGTGAILRRRRREALAGLAGKSGGIAAP